jgi:hypothetical protein
MNISLDLLERKVLPIRQEEVRIVFHQGVVDKGQGEKDVKGDTEDTQDKDGKEATFKPLAKRTVVSILDKRKQSTIDRDVILKRLQEHKLLTTRNDIMKSTGTTVAAEEESKKESLASTVPTITKRKLVIREPEKVEVGEGEGADEDQDYKDLLAMVKKTEHEAKDEVVLEELDQP